MSAGSARSAGPVQSPGSPAPPVHLSVLDPQARPVLSMASPQALRGQRRPQNSPGSIPCFCCPHQVSRTCRVRPASTVQASGTLGVSTLGPVSGDKAPPCTGLALCPYPTLPRHQFRPGPWPIIHRPAPHLPGSHLHFSCWVEPCSLQGGLSPSWSPIPSGQPPASPLLGTLSPPRGVHPWQGEQPLLSSQGFCFSRRLGGQSSEGALWVFRTSQLFSLHWALYFCLGAGSFSQVLFLLGGRFLSELRGASCQKRVVTPNKGRRKTYLCRQRREGRLQIRNRNRGPVLSGALHSCSWSAERPGLRIALLDPWVVLGQGPRMGRQLTGAV